MRAAAAEAFRFLPTPGHAARLKELLQDDSVRVRWVASRALSSIHPEDGIRALRSFLDDADPDWRVSTLRALVELKAKEAEADLVAGLSDDSWSVRYEAVRGLRALGLRKHSPNLAALLTDAAREVQRAASETLCTWGDPRGALNRLEHRDQLTPLNELRSKAACDKLRSIQITSPAACTWRRRFEELAKLASLTVEYSENSRPFIERQIKKMGYDWRHPRTRNLWEELVDGTDNPLELILEADRIRVVTQQEAMKFWTGWLKK